MVDWQSRALDKAAYLIIYFDALVLKIRQDKQIVNKSIYLALGINCEGEKELLGMWCYICYSLFNDRDTPLAHRAFHDPAPC